MIDSAKNVTVGGATSGIVSASYIIYDDSGTIKAVNGTTGVVDYSGSDASVVIQDAINALTSGGKIFIKNGTYDISNTITLRDYITIEGESLWDGTVLKLINNVNRDMFYLSPKADPSQYSHIRLCNFKIDGNNANNTLGSGINFGSMRKLRLEKLEIRNCGESGIKFPSVGNGNSVSHECIFYDLYIYDCNDIGINLSSFNDSKLINVYCQQNGSHGLILYSSNNTLFHVHCYDNANRGIVINGDNCALINCWGDTNDEHGIEIKSAYCQLVNCFSFNNGASATNTYSGINLNGATFTRVIGCHLSESGTKQKYGISEIGSADSNVIMGNTFSGNITGPINKSGYHTVIKDNIGYRTESNIVSEKFAIYSTGIKILKIIHDLNIIPNVQDCCLTVIQDTIVDDWAYNLLKIVSTDAIYITAKINVSMASKTKGATAKLGLKIVIS